MQIFIPPALLVAKTLLHLSTLQLRLSNKGSFSYTARISMTVVNCISCGLRQWVPVSGTCRRCHAKLGFSLIEIPLCDHANTSNVYPGGALRLGPRLRALRLRQGRTQANVASKARVPRTSLSRFESNLCAPSLSTLARILVALGVESLYLRLRTGSPPDRD
jgi:DNA-binding XRE family transcriptional regulator